MTTDIEAAEEGKDGRHALEHRRASDLQMRRFLPQVPKSPLSPAGYTQGL